MIRIMYIMLNEGRFIGVAFLALSKHLHQLGSKPKACQDWYAVSSIAGHGMHQAS